ncbi:paxillin-like [Polyodon spathula]|uniref:paxillin-like n=1 Tax=Polyodon spathula TaxID=7913 RepID=UPI001B7E34B3|nr:paxillin-like [Polyodon spathula]
MGKLLELDLEIPSTPSNCPPAVSERQERGRGSERERERERECERAEEEEEGGRGAQAVKKMPPSLPGKTGSSIDALLGDLSSDMEKMGVRTSAKGQCASCGKCIVGKVCLCQREQGGGLSVVTKPTHSVLGGLFAMAPRALLFFGVFTVVRVGLKDSSSETAIIVSVLGKTWHRSTSSVAMSVGGAVRRERVFLREEGSRTVSLISIALFAQKVLRLRPASKGRKLPLAANTSLCTQSALWDCLSPFSDGCFYEIDSRPLCPLHYHARKGLLCGGCRAPISGRCVSAMGKRFHPEHFVCAFCLKQLNQGVFKEQNEKPYCTGCP